jgi:Caulimovirus viroplasmin
MNLQFKSKEELSLDNKDKCILDNLYTIFFRQKNDSNKKPYLLSTLNALAYHLVNSKHKKNVYYVVFDGNTSGIYALWPEVTSVIKYN